MEQHQQEPMDAPAPANAMAALVPSPRSLQFPHLAHISAALAPEALLDAVNEGAVQLVQDLVRRDPGLANHRDGFGQTPLMWAAYKGRADLVGCLLDCGAGVNECETRRARTALYLACEFDHADVVALLLKRGADQRLPAQRGWTVLSRGFEGWTPLIIAGYNGCPAVLRRLLAHPQAELDKGDEKGATALWWAAVHNRPDAVRVLLEAGADFLKANEEGKTPAEAARERGNHDCTALLEAAERAYVMTRTRRLSRESEAWARLLHKQLLPSLGLPPYLQQRVTLDTAALPRPAPQPAGALALMIRSEEQELAEAREEEEIDEMLLLELEGELEDGMMGLRVDGGFSYSHSKASRSHSSSRGHSQQKQEGRKVDEEQEQEEQEGTDSDGYGSSSGGSSKGGEWYAAPEPLSPDMTAAEAEAQEFGDWRWGRPAPHYHDAAAASSAAGHRRMGSSSSLGSGCGVGGGSFLSRAVSSAFGSGSGSGNFKGMGMMMVPDGGDTEQEEAAALGLLNQGQLLPQAVAHYVNRRMRFDTFLQLRDMLAA